MERRPAVYILASGRNGTLYIGVTTNLSGRISQQDTPPDKAFTTRYGVRRLVFLELHASLRDARERERRLKKWRRAWKVQLIEQQNPYWRDLRASIPL